MYLRAKKTKNKTVWINYKKAMWCCCYQPVTKCAPGWSRCTWVLGDVWSSRPTPQREQLPIAKPQQMKGSKNLTWNSGYSGTKKINGLVILAERIILLMIQINNDSKIVTTRHTSWGVLEIREGEVDGRFPGTWTDLCLFSHWKTAAVVRLTGKHTTSKNQWTKEKKVKSFIAHSQTTLQLFPTSFLFQFEFEAGWD